MSSALAHRSILFLGVAGLIVVLGVIMVANDSSTQSLADRMASDCRRQLKEAVSVGRSAEWRPGPTQIGMSRDGTHWLNVAVRVPGANGTVIGVSAECEYRVIADSAFVRYDRSITQSTVQHGDSMSNGSW
jgi:hypothetical protein